MYIFLPSRPLADTEKLPVRLHRAAETPKSPTEDGEAQSASIQEPKKKSSKEKKEKKKEKDRDRKVSFCFNVKIIFIMKKMIKTDN